MTPTKRAVSNPFAGGVYVLRGARLLGAPGVRGYVVWPLVINILVFAAAVGVAVDRFDAVMQWLLGYVPGWLEWLRYLLWPLFALLVGVVVFFTFSLVANLIAAPFNGFLAEAVERRLTGSAPGEPFSVRALMKEIVPALAGEIHKLLYFLRWVIPLAVLFLIPVLNVAAPVLWLAFSAWMLAVEYADFPLGNHGLKFAQQRRVLRQRRFLSLGFGASVLALTLIPVVNFFVMPAAVAGATVMWVERFQDSAVT